MRNLLCSIILLCSTSYLAFGQTLEAGPIVGAVTPNSARCLAMTNIPGTVTIQLSTDQAFTTFRSFSNTTTPAQGNTVMFFFDSLETNTKYYYRAVINGNFASDVRSFSTYPCPGESINYVFTFGSCMNENRNNDAVFDEAKNHNSRFFLQVGDWGYPDDTDDWPNNSDFFPVDYNRVINSYKNKYNYANMKQFLKNVPIDYVWDDHDYVNNNSSRNTCSYTDFGTTGNVTEAPFPPGCRRNAIEGYYNLFPGYEPVDSSEGVFHKFRFGNTEVYMLDNRAARSPTTDALQLVGNNWQFNPPPGHSIIGDIQREWLLDNLRKSTATWKFIVTGTAFNKTYGTAISNMINLPNLAGLPLTAALIDSWSGFPMDQDSIINCVNDNGIDGVIMLSGDTHTAAIDDGGSGGLPEIMAGGLSQSNSTLYTTVPLLPFGLEWNQGGQGINGNLNVNDAFGKITIQGDDWVKLELIDENGNQIADYTMYSCSYQSGLALATDTVRDALCFGDSSGYITLTATGGTAPYSYTINGGETFQASPTFSNLPKGRYMPGVRDASGCTKELCIYIDEPTELTTNIDVTTISCIGANDGIIELTTTGGVTPYTYSWADGDTVSLKNSLAPGNYTPTLTDANGCELVFNISVTEPDSLYTQKNVTTPTCFNGDDATIQLTPYGGSAPFNIRWADNRTGTLRNNLDPGTYVFTITDSRGCIKVDSVIVGPGTPFAINATILGDDGTGNGSATLNPSGSIGPYVINWFDASTGNTIDGLSSGVYPVTIEDGNGCLQDTTVQIGTRPIDTGIDNLTEPNLNLYPNPVKGQLQMTAYLPTAEPITIRIFDLSGKMLLMKNFDATQKLETRLDLSELPAGTVMVELSTTTQQVHQKLLILE